MAGENELLEAVNQGQQQMYQSTTETAPAPETTAPPAAETTTETAAPPAADVKFDATEFAKQTFGTDNIEEVKTRYTGYEQVVNEKTTLAQQLEQVKSELPASELEKFYIQGLRKGISPDLLYKVSNMDLPKMTAEEKVKYDMAISKPYLTQDQINAQFKNKYTVNPDAIDQEEEKLLKDADLAEAANQAEIRLKDWTNKTMNPAPAQAQEEIDRAFVQKQETLKGSWKAVAPKVSEAIKEISKKVPVALFDSPDGSEFDFNYTLPAEKQQKYADMALDTYVKAGVEVNDKSIGEITEYARRIMWANEGESISVASAKQAVSHVLQDLKARFNFTELGRSSQEGAAAQKQTAIEEQVTAAIGKM